MKDTTIGIQKLLAIWWQRISIWILLVLVSLIPVFLIRDIILLNIYFLFAILAPTILIEAFRYKSKWYCIGLRLDNLIIKDLIISLFLIAIFIAAIIAILIAFEGDIVQSGILNTNTFYFIYVTIFLFVSASIEELIFRGIIFQTLIERFNPYLITIIVSLVFAFSHFFDSQFNILAFVNIFIGSIAISIMYLRTLSLWLPIFFHFFWNWMQAALFSIPVSGNDFAVGIYTLIYPDNQLFQLIFGRNYGIEEGLITTFLMIFSIFVTIKYTKASPFISSRLFLRKYFESELRAGKIDG